MHKDTEDIDLGHRSLACGRRNDALKLWLAWREKGDEGWEIMVDRFMDMADYLEGLAKDHPRLEMMSERFYANVCFRYNPEPGNENPEGVNLNDINARIRKTLI